MSLGGKELYVGHDRDGRRIAIVETYDVMSGREVISMEIGRDTTLELDPELRRGITETCDSIDELARAVGVLREGGEAA
jgi:hypothetical protein